MLQSVRRAVTGQRALLSSYVSSTVSMMVGVLAHAIGFIVVAKALGAEQFGKLTLIAAVANLGLVWCGLGSGELLRRRVARDPASYPEVFGHAVIILATTSSVIGVGLAIGLALTVNVSPDLAANFLIMLLFVISNISIFAWISMSEQILLAHGAVATANLVNISAGAGRAIAAVVACYGWGVTELKDWVFWHFGFYVVIGVACLALIAQFGRPKLAILWRELARGVTISFTNLSMVLRQNADVLALSAVAPPAVVGIYSVARRIVETASVVSASLDRLVYTNFAKAGSNGPQATLQLALRYAALSAVICAAASIALYVVAPWIPMVFGQQYIDTVATTRILAWTLILTSLHDLASDALNAAEKHEIRLAAQLAAGIAGTAILVLLTLQYALNGILVSVYVVGILMACALWSTLIWSARRQRRAAAEATRAGGA